ncbi:hypothetical protein ACH4GM_31860 [Streptomyces coeruleorubidus]|uniref:hypothetical protein n=1 Tax=Streptomyces coeruleorubidus TaxID=116188 RepID=UPI0037B86523
MKADRILTTAARGSGGKWCPDGVCGVVEAVGTGFTPFKPFKPGDEVSAHGIRHRLARKGIESS